MRRDTRKSTTKKSAIEKSTTGTPDRQLFAKQTVRSAHPNWPIRNVGKGGWPNTNGFAGGNGRNVKRFNGVRQRKGR